MSLCYMLKSAWNKHNNSLIEFLLGENVLKLFLRVTQSRWSRLLVKAAGKHLYFFQSLFHNQHYKNLALWYILPKFAKLGLFGYQNNELGLHAPQQIWPPRCNFILECSVVSCFGSVFCRTYPAISDEVYNFAGEIHLLNE